MVLPTRIRIFRITHVALFILYYFSPPRKILFLFRFSSTQRIRREKGEPKREEPLDDYFRGEFQDRSSEGRDTIKVELGVGFAALTHEIFASGFQPRLILPLEQPSCPFLSLPFSLSLSLSLSAESGRGLENFESTEACGAKGNAIRVSNESANPIS